MAEEHDRMEAAAAEDSGIGWSTRLSSEKGLMGTKGGEEDGAAAPPDVQQLLTRNVVVVDETGSLCEQCRAEEDAERAEAERARELSQSLAEHIREMNQLEVDRHRARMREEREQAEWERAEAEEREAHSRREEDAERRKEQRARSRMEAEEWAKAEEEKEMRRRERLGTNSSTFLSLEEGIVNKFGLGQEEAKHRAERLQEQMKRNNALKESIERLEQFKQRQREEDERARSSASQARRDGVATAIERARSASTARELQQKPSPKGRITSAQSRVFEAWREAREADERRYRVLQGGGGPAPPMKVEKEMVIERKRCRRCRKPMEEKKYTRYVQKKGSPGPDKREGILR